MVQVTDLPFDSNIRGRVDRLILTSFPFLQKKRTRRRPRGNGERGENERGKQFYPVLDMGKTWKREMEGKKRGGGGFER